MLRFSKHIVRSLVLVCLFACLFTVGCGSNEVTQQSGEPAEKNGDASAEQVSNTSSNASEWSMQSSCTTCHNTEEQSGQDTNTTYAAHYKMLECTTCHTDDDGTLSRAHEGIDGKEPPTRLKRTEVAASVCEGCHSRDEIASATASLDVLKDDSGTVVNPHALPSTEGHVGITCESCHVMHDSSTNASQRAPELCRSCHHAGVYVSCKNCHDE